MSKYNEHPMFKALQVKCTWRNSVKKHHFSHPLLYRCVNGEKCEQSNCTPFFFACEVNASFKGA